MMESFLLIKKMLLFLLSDMFYFKIYLDLAKKKNKLKKQ